VIGIAQITSGAPGQRRSSIRWSAAPQAAHRVVLRPAPVGRASLAVRDAAANAFAPMKAAGTARSPVRNPLLEARSATHPTSYV